LTRTIDVHEDKCYQTLLYFYVLILDGMLIEDEVNNC